MTNAEILTPWTGTGAIDDLYTPQLGETFSIFSYVDLTKQKGSQLKPSPNLMSGLFVMSGSVLAQIESDNNYFVLWAG